MFEPGQTFKVKAIEVLDLKTSRAFIHMTSPRTLAAIKYAHLQQVH